MARGARTHGLLGVTDDNTMGVSFLDGVRHGLVLPRSLGPFTFGQNSAQCLTSVSGAGVLRLDRLTESDPKGTGE